MILVSPRGVMVVSKCVYDVDPLKCPECGGQMKIVSFIEEALVIEKIVTPFLKVWNTNPSGLIYCVFCLFCGTANFSPAIVP